MPLTCWQANKQEFYLLWEVWHVICSKIVFIDEADESTVDCGWNDVIRESSNFDYAVREKYLVLPIEQKSGLSLNWCPLADV